MTERRTRCDTGTCPDKGSDGRYLGTNTVNADINGAPTTVTVGVENLINAARRVRLEALKGPWGTRAANQKITMVATKDGEPVEATFSGSTLTREARLARRAQLADILHGNVIFSSKRTPAQAGIPHK